jgi:hypothetical protein
MPRRPSLRIGQHGKVAREYLGDAVWLAQCRVRDTDGVARGVQLIGPADEYDKHGKFAVDAVMDDSARGYGVRVRDVARHLCGADDGR